MSDTIDESLKFLNEFAPWQGKVAINASETYSYLCHTAYFMKLPSMYQNYFNKTVRPALQWYDNYYVGFHDAQTGIIATGLCRSIIDICAEKVAGSNIMFRSGIDGSGDEIEEETETGNPEQDVAKITEWAEESDFFNNLALAIKYSMVGGKSLIKLDKVRGKLRSSAWRIDSYYADIDATGEITSATFNIAANIPLDPSNKKSRTYVLRERRYYGDWEDPLTHAVKADKPLCVMEIYESTGTTLNNGFQAQGECIPYNSLPDRLKKTLKRITNARLGEPTPLPFEDLGVYAFDYTRESIVPGMHYGEPLPFKIIGMLMAFDYAYSCMCTDMYIGKGKVLMPKGMTAPTLGITNSGLDSMIYEMVDYVDPEKQKPQPIQMNLRSVEWEKLLEIILKHISINVGISASTLAPFLQDNAPKTAREVTSLENQTMQYVQAKRSIYNGPLNKLLNAVRLYFGCKTKVVAKWTDPGLENKSVLISSCAEAVSSGIMSIEEAVQKINPDKSTKQVAAEVQRIKEAQSAGQSLYQDSEMASYFGGDEDAPEDEAEQSEEIAING